MALQTIKVGSRVRRFNGEQFVYGDVTKVFAIFPFLMVLWDGDTHPTKTIVGDLQTTPFPNHYHRCEWCGKLMTCSDSCGMGGRYDPYTFDGKVERNSDGTFDGGFCDGDCYNHSRTQGCFHQVVVAQEGG